MPDFKSKNQLSAGRCPSCQSDQTVAFFGIEGVPVNSVLLLQSREEALNFPRGDISLGFCRACGFIFNAAFNPQLLEYSVRYEATQSYSPSFNIFHRNLAERLVSRYNLYGKDIIEIGCGQGEFLSLLCQVGNNRGIGFDPVYDEDRSVLTKGEPIKIIQDFYSKKYADVYCDFVCCKMTLEHIQNTGEFIGNLHQILSNKPDTVVFFQVPDTVRILREIAFWDIYFEHCSYFSPVSLAHLFRRNGFEIIDQEKDYDDQYLMIVAKPGTNRYVSPNIGEDLLSLHRDVEYFIERYQTGIKEWRDRLDVLCQAGKRIVLWGASSKAVSFLTTLKIKEEVKYAVDINPLKAGTFIAGTGHGIVTPEFLIEDKPDVVIIMNPVYTQEIDGILKNIGVDAELLSL
jgi:2-polyprenyl-3-methyl-5-hydroxy-6-metoxy-1,4-benzoquinol methylase